VPRCCFADARLASSATWLGAGGREIGCGAQPVRKKPRAEMLTIKKWLAPARADRRKSVPPNKVQGRVLTSDA